MNATEVVETLRRLGISVRAKGSKLLLEPGSRVPAEMVSDIRRYKPEILTLIYAPDPPSDDTTARLLAWAAQAAEIGLTLREPVHFLETPLRPYTTEDIGKYCRDQLKYICAARSNGATGGWGRFTREWWREMEVSSISALAALKVAVDETDTQEQQ